MGFFDFLKKQKIAEEKEKVGFDELESWLKDKTRQNAEKEKELSDWIKQRTYQLVKEMDIRLECLKDLELTKRKAEDKIQVIVKENLNNYVALLEKLSGNLKNLEGDKHDVLIGRINFLFSDFEKKSFMNFQKASFYFEKELGNIKRGMSLFFKDLRSLLESNKALIDNLKIISAVSSKFDELKGSDILNSKIDSQIQEIEQKKEDLKNKIEYIEKDMKKMAESSEYSEKISKRQEAEKIKDALKQDILKLKEEVNMKSLARTFHENEKKMRIIRDYNNDFYKAFENDLGLSLITLLDEGRKEHIRRKIAEIQRKKEEISGILLEKDEIESLKADMGGIKNKIEILDKEKADCMKRAQKLEEKKQELIGIIKSDLAKINVEII
jgi:hypothetical protein